MPTSRSHLVSLRLAHAFRNTILSGQYTLDRFKHDAIAGVTVGLVAIPLSMALAIAVGLPPQYGLYTAVVAGFVIALTGGSNLSISGPTAAFVVVLLPVVQQYGLSGLLIATMLSGLILILMAILRLGRFIEYIPESVTLGFTGGIAVVIATLQIPDFLGLSIISMPLHYIDKWPVLVQHLAQTQWPALLVAGSTFATLILWKYLTRRIPAHIPALLVGVLVSLILGQYGYEIETIASRFSYLTTDGQLAQGIPPYLPSFHWPWQLQLAEYSPFSWNSGTVEDLLSAAFTMAMLGAIESLLCAVVLDGMSQSRHSANSELLGQGLGNVVAPFFGGFTATAAIARSAVNYKSGASSPMAAMIHALVVLMALAFLAPLLGWLPMPAMAAMLIMVAWNMSEAHKALHLIKRSPTEDILVFLTCFSLTVLFDMVVAITVGVLLSAVLFMQQIAKMTRLKEKSLNTDSAVKSFTIEGPLFFAAADRIFSELFQQLQQRDTVIIDVAAVHLLDAGGVSALNKLVKACQQAHIHLVFYNLSFQPLKTLARAKVQPIDEVLAFRPSEEEALKLAHNH